MINCYKIHATKEELFECIMKQQKEIDRLKEENKEIDRLKRMFKWIVIQPNQFNSGYELFNISKQELYSYLYLLRCRLLKITFGKKPKSIFFDEFIIGNSDEEKR